MNIEAFNKDKDKIDWDAKELNLYQYRNPRHECIFN